MPYLDPTRKYLLARPHGGFNDSMVQLEKVRRYAIKTGRILILDMSRSGLRAQLDSLFNTKASFGCEVIHWAEGLTSELDAIPSVFPAQFARRVSALEVEWNEATFQLQDQQTKTYTNFDFARDYSEDLLVYEQAGGGHVSLRVLQNMTLKPSIADEIIRRIAPLGADYDAMHVRHSDYQTDYLSLFRQCQALFKSRPLLICSDSYEVKAAAACLHPSTKLLSVTETPDTGGQALHLSGDIDVSTHNIDLLTDLLALAGARHLIFTHLSGGHKNNYKISGFSLLADSMRRDGGVALGLLASASPEMLARLPRKAPRSGLRTLLQETARAPLKLDEWRWNFAAKGRSATYAHRLRRDGMDASQIRPHYLGPT